MRHQRNADIAEIPRPYLQFLSVLIVNRHDHLHVLVRGLVSFVEIPLNQSHVDVIAYVTFGGGKGGEKKEQF